MFSVRVRLKSGKICKILTHFAYRANAKKRDISNDIVTVLKARGKHALAEVNFTAK